MSHPVDAPAGRGPLGTHTNRPKIDHGTHGLHRNAGPAERHSSHAAGAPTDLGKKARYVDLAYATSYAMQTKSAGQSASAWGHDAVDWIKEQAGQPPAKRSERVQSFLGGKFLRMYLDHKLDDDVVAAAGKEIQASQEFAALTTKLQAHLQSVINTRHLAKVSTDLLAKEAGRFLDAKRHSEPGIAFRRTLNTVIGGVTDAKVESVEDTGENGSEEGSANTYQVNITFYDTYDFENKRTGEYDRYRQRLAALLLANDYDKFESAFESEAIPFGKHATKLDDAAVFASFMYALEKKGWTPGGLDWHVTVPASIGLHLAPTSPAHHAKKPK